MNDPYAPKKWNRFDPVYVILYHFIFKSLFRPAKPNGIDYYDLESSEIEFLYENADKHRKILWINIVLVIYLAFHGLSEIHTIGDPGVVVTGLLAPAMVTGAAWYTVSFGGIPTPFMSVALVLTRYMFLSFTLSMTLLTALLCSITTPIISIFVLVPIYGSLYIASVYYDTMDGLKIGLDSTLLKFSRASLNYYRKHGILTSSETEVEKYADDEDGSPALISNFNHYMSMLDDALEELTASKRVAQVANHLIATATDFIVQLAMMPLSQPEREKFETERKSKVEGYSPTDDDNVDGLISLDEYLHQPHKLSVPTIDKLTISQLALVLPKLRIALGNEAEEELKRVERTVQDFESFREIENLDEADEQEIADYLFSQLFSQLSSLIKSYRHKFIMPPQAPKDRVKIAARNENVEV